MLGRDFGLVLSPLQYFINLMLTVTELKQGIEKIVELIDTSVNNWRTIQYDPWLNGGPVCLKLLPRLCEQLLVLCARI